MKTLVVYYSRTGLTKKVAEKLTAAIGADKEEIIDKDKRAGAIGYLKSGRDAMQKRLAVIEDPKISPADYDLVIIGTPTWAYSMSAPVRAYLTGQAGRFKQVAFLATHGSDGGDKAIKQMAELSGRKAKAALVVTSREVSQDKFQEKLEKFISELNN